MMRDEPVYSSQIREQINPVNTWFCFENRRVELVQKYSKRIFCFQFDKQFSFASVSETDFVITGRCG